MPRGPIRRRRPAPAACSPPTTVQVTPPTRLSTFMPRLYDATSVPSVVASGIRNSPWACSPLIRIGPARPDRDLRHPGEVLDVSAGDSWVERVAPQVAEGDAGELLGESLAPGHHLRGVVLGVVRVPGDRHPVAVLGRDGIPGRDLQPAELLGVHSTEDLVASSGQRPAACPDPGDLLKAERSRRHRRKVGRPNLVAAAEIEPELLERDVEVIHPQLHNSRQGGVAEAVLETEMEPLAVILQRAGSVQLAKEKGRNLHRRSLVRGAEHAGHLTYWRPHEETF